MQFATSRQGVPLVGRAASGSEVGEGHALGQLAGELQPDCLHQEADERRHGDAAVLDLRMAEPGDLLLGLLADGQRVCGGHAAGKTHTVSEEPLV